MRKKTCPRESLIHALRSKLDDVNCLWSSGLERDVPRRWEKHEVWVLVAEHLRCKRIARKSVVKNDAFRSPQVELVVGENGWIQQIDNHIKFTYNVTKCMFSAGNITEKLRIASWNCSDEIIVDLYAGIGYFTLPYLVHAKAKHVYACEWNPEALRRNLLLNHVHERCTVLPGDNAELHTQVNLGLIPSSESGWRIACRALRTERVGFLHIQMNLEGGMKLTEHSEPLQSKVKCKWILWVNETCERIRILLEEEHRGQWKTQAVHLEHVQSYAPHVVLDMLCEPQ